MDHDAGCSLCSLGDSSLCHLGDTDPGPPEAREHEVFVLPPTVRDVQLPPAVAEAGRPGSQRALEEGRGPP